MMIIFANEDDICNYCKHVLSLLIVKTMKPNRNINKTYQVFVIRIYQLDSSC